MNQYNHFDLFEQKYNQAILSTDNFENAFGKVCIKVYEVVENDLKYFVVIHGGIFSNRTELVFTEVWSNEISITEFNDQKIFLTGDRHRVLNPAIVTHSINGDILNYEYWLNGENIKEEKFFSHDLNKYFVVKKRFENK